MFNNPRITVFPLAKGVSPDPPAHGFLFFSRSWIMFPCSASLQRCYILLFSTSTVKGIVLFVFLFSISLLSINHHALESLWCISFHVVLMCSVLSRHSFTRASSLSLLVSAITKSSHANSRPLVFLLSRTYKLFR